MRGRSRCATRLLHEVGGCSGFLEHLLRAARFVFKAYTRTLVYMYNVTNQICHDVVLTASYHGLNIDFILQLPQQRQNPVK